MAYSRGTKIVDEISDRIIEVATDIAYNEGVSQITVVKILHRMEVSNRVFYNRFKNLDDVLVEVYENVVGEMRRALNVKYDGKRDYYEFLTDIAVSVLEKTYENKLHFAGYMFEYDSYADSNRKWWIENMKPLIKYGMDNGLIKPIDTTLIAYSIWCYCRGFNASAVGDGLSIEQAIKSFRLGFECFINGLKP